MAKEGIRSSLDYSDAISKKVTALENQLTLEQSGSKRLVSPYCLGE